MSTNNEQGVAIVARTYEKELILIDIDKCYNDWLDGENLEDNNFININMISEKSGLYKIEFDFYGDDGLNYFLKPDDPYHNFTITNVEPICQIEKNGE